MTRNKPLGGRLIRFRSGLNLLYRQLSLLVESDKAPPPFHSSEQKKGDTMTTPPPLSSSFLSSSSLSLLFLSSNTWLLLTGRDDNLRSPFCPTQHLHFSYSLSFLSRPLFSCSLSYYFHLTIYHNLFSSGGLK